MKAGVYEEFRGVPKVTADGCDVRTSVDSFLDSPQPWSTWGEGTKCQRDRELSEMPWG